MGDAAHRRGALRVCYAVFLNSKIVAERDSPPSPSTQRPGSRWTARTIELSFFKDVRHSIPSVAAITRRVTCAALPSRSSRAFALRRREPRARVKPVLNLIQSQAAKAFGLSVPASLLARVERDEWRRNARIMPIADKIFF
jgi:hypothetical protein